MFWTLFGKKMAKIEISHPVSYVVAYILQRSNTSHPDFSYLYIGFYFNVQRF